MRRAEPSLTEPDGDVPRPLISGAVVGLVLGTHARDAAAIRWLNDDALVASAPGAASVRVWQTTSR